MHVNDILDKQSANLRRMAVSILLPFLVLPSSSSFPLSPLSVMHSIDSYCLLHCAGKGPIEVRGSNLLDRHQSIIDKRLQDILHSLLNYYASTTVQREIRKAGLVRLVIRVKESDGKSCAERQRTEWEMRGEGSVNVKEKRKDNRVRNQGYDPQREYCQISDPVSPRCFVVVAVVVVCSFQKGD